MNRYLDETLVTIHIQELSAAIQTERRYREYHRHHQRPKGRLGRTWRRWGLRRRARRAQLHKWRYATSWREEVDRIVDGPRGE